MPLLRKKILRTSLLALGIARIFFLTLSLYFPRTRPLWDNVRLYFQKHIISSISEIRYRSKVGKPLKISELFSARKLILGDLLFTSNTAVLGNAFIDGKRKHLLMYLGTSSEIRRFFGQHSDIAQMIKNLNFPEKTALVIESTFEGVQIKALDQLKEHEAVVALRLELPKKELKKGILLLLAHLGKAYDFDFRIEDDQEIYCSELLYKSFLLWGFSPLFETSFLREVVSPKAMLRSLFAERLPKKLVHMLFYVESEGEGLHFSSKEELKRGLGFSSQ